MFGTAATGAHGMKSNANLTFNSSTGTLGASEFDGSIRVAKKMKKRVTIVILN